MIITDGTIDCVLSISGNGYADFQHHHWEILSHSKQIDTHLGNTMHMTWSLNGAGHDAGGSWITVNQRMPSLLAQVWFNPSHQVTLTQIKQGHELPATGSVQLENHPVTELTWPQDLIWDLKIHVPTAIIHQDGGHFFVPGSGRNSVQTVVLGRDYTHVVQWWQKPASVVGGAAVWAWHINVA